jgi:hypothetical protein
VSGFNDVVALLVDHGSLLSSGSSPQDEHHRVGERVDANNDLVSELFPSLTLMRSRFTRANGQGGIEQQDSLVCPRDETSVPWSGSPLVGLQFFEDIA